MIRRLLDCIAEYAAWYESDDPQTEEYLAYWGKEAEEDFLKIVESIVDKLHEAKGG